MDEFWKAIAAQLAELKTAGSAADVVRILASPGAAGDAFFAGSGGDDTVEDALTDAGWKMVWHKASYYYAMRAPDGSVITYIEGDIYNGDRP